MLENGVGVRSVNSNDYISRAFKVLNRGDVFVGLKNEQWLEADHFGLAELYDPEMVHGWYQGERYTPKRANLPGQLLFTSGTTGQSKTVLISHGALANTVDRLNQIMLIDSSIREYVGVPVDFSFGFGRCRAVSAAGGEFYLPENGFNPIEIATMLEMGQINAISAVPTLWRTVLECPSIFEGSGSKVKWIEIGSQYMSADEKQALRSIFPTARIVQHYGLTEASRSTFLCLNDVAPEYYESVGVALDGVELRINDDVIEVRGPHTAMGRLEAGELHPLTDSDGWLSTGDVGYLNAGYLYYRGRADDQINVGGVKISPDRVESYLCEVLDILANDIACFKQKDALLGDKPAIAITSTLDVNEAQIRNEFDGFMTRLGVSSVRGVSICRVEELPRTTTGKVKRAELSKFFPPESKPAWGLEGQSKEKNQATPSVSQAAVPRGEPTDLANRIIEIWSEVLGVDQIGLEDTFFNLGGDSLSAIRVMTKMESAGIPKQKSKMIFEGASIAQISKSGTESTSSPGAFSDGLSANVNHSSRSDAALASLSINVARGFLVIMNIAAHWMPGVVARLPEIAVFLNSFLAPAYSSGTPGFAIIFGVGVGYYMTPRYLISKQSVYGLIRRNAVFLGGGIVILVVVSMASYLSLQKPITLSQLFVSFYSVLFFYFLALISLPLWLKFTTSIPSKVSHLCLSAALACYGLHVFIAGLGIEPTSNGLLQLGVLMLTAKYNYPEMMSGVLLGMFLGVWLKSLVDQKKSMLPVAFVGCLLVVFSIVLSVELGNGSDWFVWPKPLYLWSWTFYLGVCMLLFFGVYQFLRKPHSESGSFGMFLKIMSAVGLLAFPLFVSHQLVLPLLRLLRSLSVPFALPILMTLFVLLAAYFVRKMYLIYYGASEA